MQTHSCQVSQGRKLYWHHTKNKDIYHRQELTTVPLHYFPAAVAASGPVIFSWFTSPAGGLKQSSAVWVFQNK
jgi:hypothetical protein